jgi:predicted alpha/beta-fold hydrolase
MSGFAPSWFLPGPHAQTVWGRLVRPRRAIAFRREFLQTPDGDELVLDHMDAPGSAAHLVLMHGLEGSSYSVYIQGTLAAIAKRGFSATAVNFRSCARDPRDLSRMLPNRRPRFYHSGETGDFDLVARTLASRMPATPLFAFGASLGGNVLLKWLGENPGQTLIRAAAAISVPFDLGAGADHLERSAAGRFYVSRFIRTLVPKVVRVTGEFPEARERVDLRRTLASRSFRDFDDAATAPLHGFRDADDYYSRSSSLGFVGRIDTAALVLNAVDDPFVPPAVLAEVERRKSDAVELVTTPAGGHVGFVGGALPWDCRYWAEDYVAAWLAAKA